MNLVLKIPNNNYFTHQKYFALVHFLFNCLLPLTITKYRTKLSWFKRLKHFHHTCSNNRYLFIFSFTLDIFGNFLNVVDITTEGEQMINYGLDRGRLRSSPKWRCLRRPHASPSLLLCTLTCTLEFIISDCHVCHHYVKSGINYTFTHVPDLHDDSDESWSWS